MSDEKREEQNQPRPAGSDSEAADPRKTVGPQLVNRQASADPRTEVEFQVLKYSEDAQPIQYAG